MIKKLTYRIIFVLGFLVFLNFIYVTTFYESDLKTFSPISSSIDSVHQQNPTVLYLGESSNTTFSKNDSNKLSIAQMLQAQMPKEKISAISHGAYHSGNYKIVLNRFRNKSIKHVIVTMNLRSFGPNWIYSNLETSLQQSMILLKSGPPLYRKFQLLFKAYDIKTDIQREDQFKKALRIESLIKTNQFPYENVKEWEAHYYSRKDLPQNIKELACQFIKCYGFTINEENNSRIKDFDEIVELAKKRNWKLIFHILPENLELANSLVGNQLCGMMKKNSKIIEDRYQKKGVIVINNLEKATSEHFIDKEFPTEHYDEKIREMISISLENILKKK